jgi:hypothetical protein
MLGCLETPTFLETVPSAWTGTRGDRQVKRVDDIRCKSRVVCLLPPIFICRRLVRESGMFLAFWALMGQTVGNGKCKNLVGSAYLRPVWGSGMHKRGASKRPRRFSRQCQVHRRCRGALIRLRRLSRQCQVHGRELLGRGLIVA